MDDFKNLQTAWKNQDTPDLPNLETTKKNVLRLKNELRNKYLFGILSLLATIIVLIWILVAIEFELQSTRLALALMILTIAGAAAYMMKLNLELSKTDQLQTSTKEYLLHLKSFKVKQGSFQQKGLVAYFIAMLALLYIYFYGLYFSNHMVGIIGAILVTLWAAIVWFIITPRQNAKYEKRINEMITEVERIEKQF